MDPMNEDLIDMFENEVSGDELDLMYEDFKELSYRGKEALLAKDKDLRKDYEDGEIPESELLEGLAFDLIYEMHSENDEFKNRYLEFLSIVQQNELAVSEANKAVLNEIIQNVNGNGKDLIVVIVYRIDSI